MWIDIKTAPVGIVILASGFSFGDKTKPRFYIEVTRYNDDFYAMNDDGEEYEVGFLTHWLPVP